MSTFQETVAAYTEIFESMTMQEIAEEMGWSFPFASSYRKHNIVRDAAIIMARREHPVSAAPGSAWEAERNANS